MTFSEYKELKKIVLDYEFNNEIKSNDFMHNKISELNKNDYIIYKGGSTSRNLIFGKKYVLTCKPWRNLVSIINETGNKNTYKNHLFKI